MDKVDGMPRCGTPRRWGGQVTILTGRTVPTARGEADTEQSENNSVHNDIKNFQGRNLQR